MNSNHVLLSTASTDNPSGGQLSEFDGDDGDELRNSDLLDAESLACIDALIASTVQCEPIGWLSADR